jgi:hypothetical protein
VTPAENTRRSTNRAVTVARHKARTHCPNGHEYTQENTGRWRGERVCRACSASRKRLVRLAYHFGSLLAGVPCW